MSRRPTPAPDPLESGSRVPELAGYALLVAFLDDDQAGWLRFIHDSLTAADLASDQNFTRWLEREMERDPSLIARVRRVVTAFREDLLSGMLDVWWLRNEEEGGH